MEALGDAIVAGEAPHAHDFLPPVGQRLGQSESGLQAALTEGLDNAEQFGDVLPARLLGEGFQAKQSADSFLHLVDGLELRIPGEELREALALDGIQASTAHPQDAQPSAVPAQLGTKL